MPDLVARERRTFTVAATSEATDHPATNLALWGAPFRTWRSTSLDPQLLTLDLGAATTIAGVFLEHANFAAVTIETSPDATDWTTRYAGAALAVDPRVGRRHGFFLLDPTAVVRAVRLTPASAEAGAPGYELGSVVLPYEPKWITRGAGRRWPMRYVREHPRAVAAFASGGEEVLELGPPRLALVWDVEAPRRDPDALAEFDALGAIALGEFVVLAEGLPEPGASAGGGGLTMGGLGGGGLGGDIGGGSSTTGTTSFAYLAQRVDPDVIEETFTFRRRPAYAWREVVGGSRAGALVPPAIEAPSGLSAGALGGGALGG